MKEKSNAQLSRERIKEIRKHVKKLSGKRLLNIDARICLAIENEDISDIRDCYRELIPYFWSN